MSESWDQTVVKVLGVGLPILLPGVAAGLGAWMFEESAIYAVRKYRWVLPVGAALSATALSAWFMRQSGGISALLGGVSK